ncbi:alkaline phosphatase synthesis transcriptional regulatory protein PhoP [Abditibacteriota bacterium]|nr:alkaline phosphatase synthesis transcriptional regulatory protein PhoP [Abditibacteriota bacterium]
MNSQNTILIVDDEQLLVETISFNLERAGFLVLKAFDGESGLAQALESKPQLMILDVMLPHLSGWDVCRTLRAASPYGKVLPILMLTARGEARDREKSFAAGASDYMLKPFSMQDLIDRIQTLLNGVEAPQSDVKSTP